MSRKHNQYTIIEVLIVIAFMFVVCGVLGSFYHYSKHNLENPKQLKYTTFKFKTTIYLPNGTTKEWITENRPTFLGGSLHIDDAGVDIRGLTYTIERVSESSQQLEK